MLMTRRLHHLFPSLFLPPRVFSLLDPCNTCWPLKHTTCLPTPTSSCPHPPSHLPSPLHSPPPPPPPSPFPSPKCFPFSTFPYVQTSKHRYFEIHVYSGRHQVSPGNPGPSGCLHSSPSPPAGVLHPTAAIPPARPRWQKPRPENLLGVCHSVQCG